MLLTLRVPVSCHHSLVAVNSCSGVDGGKGAPGLVNALMDKAHRSTVWLIPLLSMQEQLMLRCQKLGMAAAVWSFNMDVTTMPTNLLLILETTRSDALRRFLQEMSLRRGLIARIIIDEAHLIVAHDHFREIMSTLMWVGQLGIQVVIQSATIPPSVLPHLFEKLGITQYRTCREPTVRPNISYRVLRVPSPELEITRMVAENQAGTGKMLIFCTSHEDVDNFGTLLGINRCTGRTSEQELNGLLSSLRQGIIRVLVSTPVLGVALDVPQVDMVVHMGCPFSMIGYTQEAGRGGRAVDSMSCSIVILPQTEVRPHKAVNPDYIGVRLIHHHVLNTHLCRQWLPSLFNDGVGKTCTMMFPVANLCDVCLRRSPPNEEEPIQYSDAMISEYLVRE